LTATYAIIILTYEHRVKSDDLMLGD